jgi:DNA-binding MarR family transcriptional regulator
MLTLLELVLQLHGEFRRRLESFRVTPLQAGVLLFLRRHAEANITDAAAALRVRQPTLSDVVKDLVRKRWVTNRRSVTDTRVVCLSLSRRGEADQLQDCGEAEVSHENAQPHSSCTSSHTLRLYHDLSRFPNCEFPPKPI